MGFECFSLKYTFCSKSLNKGKKIDIDV